MMRRRRTIQGYLDMGKPIIPPRPINIVMTDRDDGTLYFLSHTGDEGSMTLDLSTTLPTKPDTRTFGPLDGPYVPGNFRLFIASGTLDFERIAPADWPISNQRVLTRSGNGRRYLEIGVDVAGENLTYTEVTE